MLTCKMPLPISKHGKRLSRSLETNREVPALNRVCKRQSQLAVGVLLYDRCMQGAFDVVRKFTCLPLVEHCFSQELHLEVHTRFWFLQGCSFASGLCTSVIYKHAKEFEGVAPCRQCLHTFHTIRRQTLVPLELKCMFKHMNFENGFSQYLKGTSEHLNGFWGKLTSTLKKLDFENV